MIVTKIQHTEVSCKEALNKKRKCVCGGHVMPRREVEVARTVSD